MLKSTYKPSAAVAAATAPLPPGWTEHKAPSGHTYFYNAETKESTYKRPGVSPQEPAPTAAQTPHPNIPNLSDPRVANAYLAQRNPQQQHQQHARGGHGGGRGGGRGGFEGRPRPQPIDKPRRKEAIPGFEPWILVYTKYSRRFVYNPVKNASYWRIPEKLMPGILELDKARLQKKASGDEETEGVAQAKAEKAPQDLDGDSSEYEEIEVTDDEAEGDIDGEHPSKRQRTDGARDEDEEPEGPLEFTEADIQAQLQMMGEDYGLEPGDYDDGNMEAWPEGTAGVEFSEEDAELLFRDLLNDFNINPYSPWEKLLEEGKAIDDPRYTALSTTKARRDCWDKWSREKITELKERRAKEEKKDPRVAYMALLQDKATPKLYWPEFKRKYKKEEPMRDLKLADKDREKAYREHIARLKMPQATLKADLTALLKAQPASRLHGKSLASGGGGLPAQVLGDVRYISLAPAVRDPLVEAYVQTLPPPAGGESGEGGEGADEEEQARRDREARDRRERALRERDRAVEEQRRRRERDVAASKARLRDGERAIDLAMRVDKRGLQSQLQEGGGGQ
ncbi:alpha/beta-Hydrolase [Purpureocillium lavendulum]|uniref:Alpha/beta-Hydrolase n=1 Tax=Purpureocillium lavendulum TaxID=1247861 RepID=A0AB34FIS9_9HYPO|nr:alpha/beta-Hydrolase [Purpureocillium lavendulum]